MWNPRFTIHFYKLWASSASAVIRSWFIYELQKSTTIAFSRNSLYTFYSRNPTCGIPPCLRISNRKYPPCPQKSIIVNPPSPSEILKAVRGMVWIFSGIAHFTTRRLFNICRPGMVFTFWQFLWVRRFGPIIGFATTNFGEMVHFATVQTPVSYTHLTLPTIYSV